MNATIAAVDGPARELQPTLPVLDAVHAELGGLARSCRALVGLQHLFGSTATLVHRLAHGRLDPHDVTLLGKPYSTNPRVAAHLRTTLGYNVHRDSTEQPVDQPNDAVMDRRILQVLDRVARRHRWRSCGPDARLVLIDDGGRAIRLLHHPRYDAIRPAFTCVEQTRCGVRTVADLDLEVPVINVAESWAKLDYESPLIADSVQDQLQRKLAGLARAGIPVPRHTLVIGYGSIGQAVARTLRDTGRTVAVHDADRARLASARRDGWPVIGDLGDALRRGGVIVGCTGLPAVTSYDYDRIARGSLLISASSADVEFQAWNLRRDGVCLGDPAGWDDPNGGDLARRGHPCTSLYRVATGRGAIYLVNGGFPVNFDGGVDTIAPDLIQLTRTLLYAGAVQASHERTPGLHPLDDDAQARVVAAWTGARGRLAA